MIPQPTVTTQKTPRRPRHTRFTHWLRESGPTWTLNIAALVFGAFWFYDVFTAETPPKPVRS